MDFDAIPLGAAQAASSGARPPPAATKAPSLRKARRSGKRFHGRSLSMGGGLTEPRGDAERVWFGRSDPAREL